MTDTATERGSFRLVYRSRNLLDASDGAADLGAIFLSARSNNREQGITGALLVTDGYFVQTLEGPEDAVRALYDRIEKDSRHDTVTLLRADAVDEPVFSRWAMAQVGESADSDIPLLADRKRGVVRAAGHPTTPDQDAVLDYMREAAQGWAGLS